jgi:spore maturation protein CgeB
VATGLAPLERHTIDEVGALGAVRLNYLTDDPWNPAHRAGWFLDALAGYDRVFSPRRANLEELRQAGCGEVAYLPFAFNPEQHYPQAPYTQEEQEQLACDVAFVGAADRDRLPFAEALVGAGLHVALYGGFWERYARTRPFSRGLAGPETLRKATAAAKITLCLVRRANRDGHVMRSFEAAASGACLLMEHTAEHEELFGPDGEAVLFFHDLSGLRRGCDLLLGDEGLRRRLAEAVRRRVTEASNTYYDRLRTMLASAPHLACHKGESCQEQVAWREPE